MVPWNRIAMCAIVDNSVRGELTNTSNEIAKGFLDWWKRRGHIVIGGSKLRKELEENNRFTTILQAYREAGKVIDENDRLVDSQEEELRREGLCISDDEHVVALARVSRARILYTNDRDLQTDFTTKQLIDDPRGRVVSTLCDTRFVEKHRRMLHSAELCGRPG